MSRYKKNYISFSHPVLHGAISTVYLRCGKKNCSCKKKPPILHGPYYRWTGIINKLQTTRTISKEVAIECKKRIRNYKKIVQRLEKLKQEGLKVAPWITTDK